MGRSERYSSVQKIDERLGSSASTHSLAKGKEKIRIMKETGNMQDLVFELLVKIGRNQ